MSNVMICRGCNAKVFFAGTVKGRRMPIDLKPNPLGNIMLRARPGLEPLAIVLNAQEIEALSPNEKAKIYITHFATCASAAKFRKGRRENEKKTRPS